MTGDQPRGGPLKSKEGLKIPVLSVTRADPFEEGAAFVRLPFDPKMPEQFPELRVEGSAFER